MVGITDLSVRLWIYRMDSRLDNLHYVDYFIAIFCKPNIIEIKDATKLKIGQTRRKAETQSYRGFTGW